MANFKKTITTARAKVVEAEIDAFEARLEAIDAILKDASPHHVLTLCARALAEVAPNCCEAHEDEFKAEFLKVLSACVTIRQEQDEDAEDEKNCTRHRYTDGTGMSDLYGKRLLEGRHCVPPEAA